MSLIRPALPAYHPAQLQPRQQWAKSEDEDDGVQFQIDGKPTARHATPVGAHAPDVPPKESFNVTGVGLVVSGTVSRGTLHANSTLLLGPFSDGTFSPVLAKTVHCKVPH